MRATFFFRGPLLLEKKRRSTNSTQEFASKILACKIRFPEFNPKFGSGRSGHHSLFSVHMLFPQVFFCVQSRFLSATRTPNSQNHSYVHYSLSKFTGEWFTNDSNHIHIFTPITRIVANSVLEVQNPLCRNDEGVQKRNASSLKNAVPDTLSQMLDNQM